MSQEIRILIADDHPIVRKGLREVIEHEPGLVVIAEAGDGEAGLALIQKLHPDVAVLDLDMPKLDGFTIARETRKSNLSVNIIFLTFHTEIDLLHEAMEVGGKGYILKEGALIEIVAGVQAVAAGQCYVSPSLTPALLERRRRVQGFERSIPGLQTLSTSEQRILRM
ncbi:MAG: response regulator transcription factor, partial [Acidobacteriaceae bacterium]|nr:response regulator transcription factor [Acidobacteriaceae bacterium]